MATVITAVATCCRCKSNWTLETNENAPQKLWCAGKAKPNSQCCSVLGMASHTHYLNGPAVLYTHLSALMVRTQHTPY